MDRSSHTGISLLALLVNDVKTGPLEAAKEGILGCARSYDLLEEHSTIENYSNRLNNGWISLLFGCPSNLRNLSYCDDTKACLKFI